MYSDEHQQVWLRVNLTHPAVSLAQSDLTGQNKPDQNSVRLHHSFLLGTLLPSTIVKQAVFSGDWQHQYAGNLQSQLRFSLCLIFIHAVLHRIKKSRPITTTSASIAKGLAFQPLLRKFCHLLNYVVLCLLLLTYIIRHMSCNIYFPSNL